MPFLEKEKKEGRGEGRRSNLPQALPEKEEKKVCFTFLEKEEKEEDKKEEVAYSLPC